MKNSKKQIDPHLSPEMMIGYHLGDLSNGDMHAVESHLLECGLCADAFEGYGTIDTPEVLLEDLIVLDRKIEGRTKTRIGSFKRVYGIAAALLVLIASTFLILNMNSEAVEEQVLTQKNEPVGPQLKQNSLKPKMTPPSKSSNTEVDVPQNQPLPLKEQLVKNSQKSTRSEESRKKNVQVDKRSAQEALANVSDEIEVVSGFVDEEVIEEIVPVESGYSVELEELSDAEVEIPLKTAQRPSSNAFARTSTKVEEKVVDTRPESNKTITGVITSGEKGEAIPGVLVLLKESQVNSISDIEGKYTIHVPDSGGILSYSFIGLETQEQVIGDNENSIDIEMAESERVLSEVVVSARGIKRESRSLGYAVSTVEDDDINESSDNRVAKNKMDNGEEIQVTSSSEVLVGVERSAEAIGQQVDRTRDDITEPVPVGGWRKYKKYLKQNLIYPQEAINNDVVGKVIITFYVEPNGELTFMKIQEGLGHGCDEEAIRLIVNGPDWRPGYLEGETIQLKTTVRVKFESKK